MASIFDVEQDLSNCEIANVIPIVNNKWVFHIVYYLSFGTLRYREIRRKLPHMADSNVTKALRNVEEFGLIHRHDFKTLPSSVEYSLTEVGRELITVMKAMEDFARYYCKNI